ncbi:toxin, partial [Pseudomonas prosekii]
YPRHMFIDPASNRGVRWSEGEPPPDFASLFDPHGNLLALQPGQDLQWNTTDQLAAVTLIKRDSSRDDEEIYRYSEGARICKRLETHTASTTHFHEVIYLPGLEIRKRDNGEELHVITLPSGAGSVRCLHWASGKPGAIDADQLRYSLDDHLGSSLMELDQQARLISHEGYYPFGGTAWLTADSALQASYKTIRYSGKEMDVTGLYYYGMRYYASWLQRWISADPAGDIDGLNLYAMVGNNPVTFLDVMGLVRGDHLHNMVSDRTTAIVTGANRHPLQLANVKKYTVKAKAQAQQAHEALYPDSRFTTSYKDKTLIAHAGAAVNASSPDETLYITDNFNITKNEDTLSLQAHGVHMHRPADSSLARDHAANGGILKFDPQRYIDYLSDLYVERFNDITLPVAIYQGPTSQSLTMAGLEYETAPIHELMANRITGHIAAAENLLPKDFRLPGAHAEVQAANLALHFQKRELGSVDPAQIDVVTQKLQRAVAATDFPACFNCTQILLNAYDNTSPFNVLTGKTDMTHSKWNSAVLEYR